MKSKKTFSLFLILFIGFHFHNCSSNDDLNDCNCGDAFEFFDVKGVEHSQLKFNSESNEYQIINPGDIIAFADYSSLSIEFIVDFIAQSHRKKNYFDFNFSTMASAYACSCLENGYNGAKYEGISSLNIITLHDYNENYKANDNINSIIEFSNNISNNGIHRETYEEFISLNTENIKFKYSFLKPNQEPSSGSTIEFKLIFELTNGEIYEIVTTKFSVE